MRLNSIKKKKNPYHLRLIRNRPIVLFLCIYGEIFEQTFSYLYFFGSHFNFLNVILSKLLKLKIHNNLTYTIRTIFMNTKDDISSNL